MDESFFQLHKIIADMAPLHQDLSDDSTGFNIYINRFDIETPVELDLMTGQNGEMQIGSIPPLYPIDTSFKPSYHKIKFSIVQNSPEHDF